MELAETAFKQAQELAFFPIWYTPTRRPSNSPSTPRALRPGDLNKVFFSTGGGEAVETAWKLAKQYKLTGNHTKYKVISRAVAYHGTPQGALSITGLPALKAPLEPLVPGAHKVPNTNIYRAPIHGDDPEAFGRWAADQIEQEILFEGPETVAAVFLEPVQNAGGSSRRRPATSSACARSATSTTCCSSRTRSSAPSAASARCSRVTSSTTCRTSSPAPRA